MAVVFFLVICEQFAAEMLFPFAAFMVEDFNLTTAQKSGYYVGILNSSYGFTQFFSGYILGRLSDKLGRRPILLLGAFMNVLTMIIFGLSTNFGYAISFRALQGLVNGNQGLVRAVVGDITNNSTEKLAWSIHGLGFGIGRILATVVGGLTARPVLQYPNLFSSSVVFKEFPYLLPCLIAAVYMFFTFAITYFFLPETNSKLKKSNSESALLINTKIQESSNFSLFHLPRDIYVILVSCFLIWLGFIIFDEVFTLWSKLSTDIGGLGFQPKDAGIFFAIFGSQIILNQAVIYPLISKKFKSLNLYKVGMLILVPTHSALPFTNLLVGQQAWMLWISLLIIVFSGSFAATLGTNSLSVIANNSVPDNFLGSLNGMIQSCMALSRIIAPTLGATIFTWSITNNIGFPFNSYFLYFLLSLIQIFIVLLSFMLSSRLNEKKVQEENTY